MAVTKAQAEKFINEIAPLAQEAYEKLGKVLPSVCIGMACVESGYGTSKIMYNHHAVLGQKVGTGRTATKYWSKEFFVARTKEEYKVGEHTIIKDAFRAYNNLRQCVFNYYELLNTSLYKRVKAGADYKTQMQQIKACGYMTSSTEVNSVIYCIQTYNLTRFDGVNENNEDIDDVTDIAINHPTLRKGDRNNFVKAWQIYLNRHGYCCGDADGIFGDKTLKAVKAYQKDRGLTPDGVIGPLTWATL